MILNWKEDNAIKIRKVIHKPMTKIIRIIFISFLTIHDFAIAIYETYVLKKDSQTGYIGHLCGAIAGILVGFFILKNRRWDDLKFWSYIIFPNECPCLCDIEQGIHSSSYFFSEFFHGNLQFSGSVSPFLQFLWLLELFGTPRPTISSMIISENQNITKMPRNVFNTSTSKGLTIINLFRFHFYSSKSPPWHTKIFLHRYIITYNVIL